jgi:hypothetical protein
LAGYEAEEKRVRDNLSVEALIKERAEAKGIAKGRAKGREEGMAKREQEIIKTLLSQGYSHQKIEEMIGVKLKD